ncbi:asparagine synthase (glutamine-hydrolyzing) [Amycolatopsis sp.]|uniref:asparagine synthase (glutamine-hydrolyzing) n=1 Tax=Amycolatopsis sp. TaxID=37632 RepID=UPI002DFADD31|nr:asparagine synthase (glutamine-hydrolyzing) [Amycolatopsis sp.]
MCGIAGFLDSAADPGSEAARRSRVAAMTGRIAHRGPDATAVVIDGPFALGFTRLCVVDADTTSQPFRSSDGHRIAAVNGTIYNHARLRDRLSGRHRFRTASDCEVVPHLVEEVGAQRCLAELDGMFAAVVWNSADGTVDLLRDRFGIKPLYTYRHGTRTYFASEIKAFLAIPGAKPSFDWDTALNDPLIGGVRASAPLPQRSLFLDVEVVEPGTVVRLAGDGRRTVLCGELTTAPGTSGERRESLREALSDAVRDTFAVTDSRYGTPAVLLSGGFDSAVIAALGARAATPSCYTIDHPATRANGDRQSSAALAAHLGLPLHVVDATGAEARDPDAWRSLLYTVETPMCGIDTLLKSEAVRAASARNVRVLLSGTGADEVAGGFTTVAARGHQEPSWADFAARGRGMARMVAGLAAPGGLCRWDAMLPEPVVRHGGGAPVDEEWFRSVRDGRIRDLALFGLQIDDRITAAEGMECRVPFLGGRVADLFAGIGAAEAGSSFWDKALLRDAVEGLIPDQWRLRPKTPFGYAASASRYLELDVVNLLAAKDFSLVRAAIENPSFKDRFDHDAVWRCALALQDDPSFAEPVLRLVNMSLLDTMFSEHAEPGGRRHVPVVVTGTEQPPEPTGLSGDDVLTLRDEVLLLGDVRVPDLSPLIVSVTGRKPVMLDRQSGQGRQCADLLSRIDGATTLSALADDVGCSPATASELLAELVGAGFVTVVGQPLC